MSNLTKQEFLINLKSKFHLIKKLPNSLSLYDVGDSLFRIYIRYSKIHSRNQAFYGIRKEDLKELEGYNSFIVFLCDNQEEPLFVPYSEFEEIFDSLIPSSDRQIKCSIFFQEGGMELYIASAGRFNVEGYLGWKYLLERTGENLVKSLPELNHSQVQTFIGSIGLMKGYEIWIPQIDRNKLDWKIAEKFNCVNELPQRYEKIIDIIREIDIIWLKRGSGEVNALFEVEHSTPIYSGLLRFNDLHIIEPRLNPKYSIVSNDARKSLFLKQINRPTFTASGLIDYCNFLDYRDVYFWYNRISKDKK